MYVHEVIARTLDAMGVDTIFGLIGDGNLYMADSFTRETGGRFIAVAHEASAVLAAAGYSRTTGRLGVAAVTHGPALTNTVTALIEGVRARTPLVLLAGDTAVVDRDNLQKIDQRSVILPTGAGFVQVRSPETIPEDIVSAFRERGTRAPSGRAEHSRRLPVAGRGATARRSGGRSSGSPSARARTRWTPRSGSSPRRVARSCWPGAARRRPRPARPCSASPAASARR